MGTSAMRAAAQYLQGLPGSTFFFLESDAEMSVPSRQFRSSRILFAEVSLFSSHECKQDFLDSGCFGDG
jgi:hypothetical protein